MKASHSLIEALLAMLILWLILEMISHLDKTDVTVPSTYLYDQLDESCSILCHLDVHKP
jgi:hypothetical protein